MRLAWWIGTLAVVGAAGCGPKVAFEEDSAMGGSDSGVDSSGSSSGGAQTTLPTTTAVTITAGTDSSGTTTFGPGSTSGIPTTTGPTATDPTIPTATVTVTTAGTTSTGPTGGGANGDACDVDDQCDSGFCFFVPLLGGVCGECNTDADCPFGGCTSPNPINGLWAMCNEGELGDGCDNTNACEAPLLCAEIIDVPGVLSEATCSECFADTQCGGGLCSPTYDIFALSGSWQCVAPGSVPLGEGCALFGSGDQACESGFCAEANLMGLVSLGVCSACETSADCPNNGTCVPPEIDLAFGLVPGFCQ